MLSNPKVIESLVQKFVEAVHPLKIILFGSNVKRLDCPCE